MKQSSRVALGYLLISVAWIAISDQALSTLFPASFPTISVYKGWGFVLLTGFLLKLVLAGEERRRDAVEARLRELAIHDPLTGLLNRGAFVSHLENALARAQRSGVQLALLFMDLDGFKAVNDSQGHDVGDQLLKAAVARMRLALRHADTAARLGGDEFVILVEPEANQGAHVLARRLLEAFREPFALDDRCLRVTLSIGIARFPEDGGEAEHLLRAADMAMYQAKAGGRDGFRLAGGPVG